MKWFIPILLFIIAFALPRMGHTAEGLGSIIAFAENGNGCDDSLVRLSFTYTPKINDGNNRDWVQVALYDGAGMMLAYGAYGAETVTNIPTRVGRFVLRFNALGNTPTTRPFIISFREGDGTTPPNDFENLTELVRYPVDPVAIGATRCDTLPYTPLGIGLDDGRINWMDNAQTVAVYCETNGNITLLAISQETGRALYALRVTVREITRVAIPKETSALIKADMRNEIRLYRLSSGEFQVVAPYTDAVNGTQPNGYSFIWTGCEAPTQGVTR
jgi:hypothetical protein